MKMTRSKLKGIVKECLVEILSEGIDSSVDKKEINESRSRRKSEAIREENIRLEAHRKSLDEKIASTVSSLTSDSVMQDILADTARNTLQEQLNHEGARPGQASSVGQGINLDGIFSGAADNWSQLAFSDKKIS